MRALVVAFACCALPALAAEPIVAVARFPCDDKQAAPDTCDEAAWQKTALLDPTQGNDLFKHEFGGPAGGVWNGAAPIVLFVKGSDAPVTLNGVKVATTRAGDWRWVRVPLEQWLKLLKPTPERINEQITVRVGKQVVGTWWFAFGE
jgi:hypothetical protein